VRPSFFHKGLPGARVLAIRAGMIMTVSML